MRELAPIFATWGNSEESAICKPGNLSPGSWTSSLQNWENKLLTQPPSLQCFVTAARENQNMADFIQKNEYGHVCLHSKINVIFPNKYHRVLLKSFRVPTHLLSFVPSLNRILKTDFSCKIPLCQVKRGQDLQLLVPYRNSNAYLVNPVFLNN